MQKLFGSKSLTEFSGSVHYHLIYDYVGFGATQDEVADDHSSFANLSELLHLISDDYRETLIRTHGCDRVEVHDIRLSGQNESGDSVFLSVRQKGIIGEASVAVSLQDVESPAVSCLENVKENLQQMIQQIHKFEDGGTN